MKIKILQNKKNKFVIKRKLGGYWDYPMVSQITLANNLTRVPMQFDTYDEAVEYTKKIVSDYVERQLKTDDKLCGEASI